MNLLRNSIITISNSQAIEDGTYRILQFLGEDNVICLHKLHVKSSVTKPVLLNHDIFIFLLANKNVTSNDEALPLEVLSDDKRLSKENREARKRNYSYISDLVENPLFLKTYASFPRCNLVVQHAKLLSVSTVKIHRLLKKYWDYGQVPNALLNFYSNCGGKGKDKRSSSRQRGRPQDNGIYGLRKRKGVNVTDEVKVDIEAAMREHLESHKKISFSKAYEIYKDKLCSEEIQTACEQKRPAQIITAAQFRYWVKKLISKEERIKAQVNESTWKREYEGLNSSVSDKVTSPGVMYEIDSTIADVYIVCEVSRERVIGRPTVYMVVDVASRMIVGLHISMEYASWVAARQALFNACMPKFEYCARYGINIDHDDWPCVGMPIQLSCDRGEMLGKEPFKFAEKIGTILNIAPPYRGDAKSIVERRFGILNEEIHFMPGTTLGELRERGESDVRLAAALTINAFTKIIIDHVLAHNKDRLFDQLIRRELIQADLKYSPLNYWNFYVSNFRCSLKYFSADHFIVHLMKKGVASVAGNGILFRGYRYSCTKAVEECWSTRALHNGTWKLECRYDESWTTDIYIRDLNTAQFLKCQLLDAERTFKDLHEADIIFIEEWKKSKRDDAELDANKIERSKRSEGTIKEEVKKTAVVSANVSNTSKVTSIRNNRKEYLEDKKPKFPIANLPNQFPVSTISNRNRDYLKKVFDAARNKGDDNV